MRHLHIICDRHQRSALVSAGIFRYLSNTHVRFFESLEAAEEGNFNFTHRKVIACVDTAKKDSSAAIDYYRSQYTSDPIILFFDIQEDPHQAVRNLLLVSEHPIESIPADSDYLIDCANDEPVSGQGVTAIKPHAPISLSRQCV